MKTMKLCCAFAGLLAGVAACGKAPQAPAPVTIQEYMEGEINPAAELLFRSVQEISDSQGTRLKAPRSDAEWKAVRDQLDVLRAAPVVLTARGLKAAPPGFKAENPSVESTPEWIQAAVDTHRADFNRRAFRLRRAADTAMRAARAQDPRALQSALDSVDKACESCHLRYFYPNDKRAQQAAKENGIVD
jgi:hypothetical protein